MSEDLQERINAIVARYKPEIDRLEAEGQRLKNDYEEPSAGGAIVGVDFQVEWKDERIVFDLPSITMRDKRVAFDVPQVTMKTRKVIFHTPSIRMVRKKVGEYPEIHGWTIKWKPIYAHVPEPFMERQEISFDIPEVKMDRVDLTIQIPEFRMERVEWVISLPQFTLINVRAETEELKAKGDELSRRGAELSARMKAEIQTVIQGVSSTAQEVLTEESDNALAAFDKAIGQVSGAIDQLVARKIDPIKVPAEGGDVNLRKTLAELIASRETAAAAFDEVNEATPLPLAA